MRDAAARFPLSMRALHWLMAAMVLAMLLIGFAMVTSLTHYHRLVSAHRPLGIVILVLVVIRFVNRMRSTLPPFPATMSRRERQAAHVSELLMYGLLFTLPLVGWGMLSAGSFPVVLFGPVHLPRILPDNAKLYWALRQAHTVLAYLLFATILAHLTAVLFHTLVIRDGLLLRMSLWPASKPKVLTPSSNSPAVPGTASNSC
jgi:cytochrome b561